MPQLICLSYLMGKVGMITEHEEVIMKNVNVQNSTQYTVITL